MTEDQPKISSAKVTFAILGAIALAFAGCSLISTQGRAFEIKGSWEVFAFLCLVFAGALIFILYRLAFKSKPALTILPDRVEYFAWRAPVMFDEIEEVFYDPGNFLMKQSPTLELRLKSGERRPVSVFLMNQGHEEVADLLHAALERHRASTPPLS